MRRVLLTIFIMGALLGARQALSAPTVSAMTTEQFLARCKTDPGFCQSNIAAQSAALTKARRACLPPKMSKDEVAARVENVLGDALEEAPDIFSGGYQGFVDQIITFLWPCENRIIS